jgi:hypothetical protein
VEDAPPSSDVEGRLGVTLVLLGPDEAGEK